MDFRIPQPHRDSISYIYAQGRQSGLKSGGAERGGAEKVGVCENHFSSQENYGAGQTENPNYWGNLGPKPTLGGGFEPCPDFQGGAEKVVVHMYPLHSLDWRPCICLYILV